MPCLSPVRCIQSGIIKEQQQQRNSSPKSLLKMCEPEDNVIVSVETTDMAQKPVSLRGRRLQIGWYGYKAR